MSKYIIELDENAKEVVVISLEDGDMWTETMEVEDLEQLNSDYINEHYGQLQQDAYDKGYKDGRNVTETQAHNDAYQRGFEDGKAVHEKGCEGCEHECENKMTPTCILCCNAYKNRWIAKSDKIEVGDEVEPFYTDITGVVTLIDGDTIYVLWRDGSSTSTLKLKEVTKTGRHFDIASILEDMRND